jgi:hypothetical protein
MLSCCSIARKGCQGRLSKAVNTRHGQNSSPVRGSHNLHSRQTSPGVVKHEGCRTRCPIRVCVGQKTTEQSLCRGLFSVEFRPCVLPSSLFSSCSLHCLPMPAAYYGSRYYSSEQTTRLPPRPPISKPPISRPSGAVTAYRINGAVITKPAKMLEPSLRKAQVQRVASPYKESAENLYRAKMHQVLNELLATRLRSKPRMQENEQHNKALKDGVGGVLARLWVSQTGPQHMIEESITNFTLKVIRGDTQSPVVYADISYQLHREFQRSIDKIERELVDISRKLCPLIQRSIINIECELVHVSREICARIPQLHMLLVESIANFNARIVAKEEMRRALEEEQMGRRLALEAEQKDKRRALEEEQMQRRLTLEEEQRDKRRALENEYKDRDHRRAAPEREARLNAWWADVEATFEESGNSNDQHFRDLTTRRLAWNRAITEDYEHYTHRLAEYFDDNSLQIRVKELLYRIHAALLEIIDESEQLSTEAHYIRLYRRLYKSCLSEPSAFHFVIQHTPLEYVAAKLLLSVRSARLHSKSYNRILWTSRSGVLRLGKPDTSNRIIDLWALMEANATALERFLEQIPFGMISSDNTPAQQRRRAQAAALTPFLALFNEISLITREIKRIMRKQKQWSLEGYPEVLKLLYDRLARHKRMMFWDFDKFTVANWRRNGRCLNTRTVFLKPPNQPEPLLSPVLFSVPPMSLTRSNWNYNDYRGPDGEMISITYARGIMNMDLALQNFQHNGVVSVDVRWASPTEPADGMLLGWFGRYVSVVTLSTQSEIVVCHFNQSYQYRRGVHVPPSLKSLLEDPRIVKVGIEIGNLRKRIEKYLGIFMTGTCDIGSLDISVQSTSSAGAQVQQPADVVGLVQKYFNKHLLSAPQSHKSWLQDFSLDQLQSRAFQVIGSACTYKV